MAETPSLQEFTAGHSNSSEHTDDTVDSPLYSSNEFRMFCYKVLPCSKRFPHTWQTCPFAHPGEKARRRCVRSHGYSAVPCPSRQQGRDCPRGDACSMTHSIFEYWLHPDMYRTQLCNDMENCNRSVCFFAHSLAELRVPSLKPCTRETTQLSPVTGGCKAAAAMLRRTASMAPSVVSNCSTLSARELSESPLAASALGTAWLAHASKHTILAGGSSTSSPWEEALQWGASTPNAIACDRGAATSLQYNKCTTHQQQPALAPTHMGATLKLMPQPAGLGTFLGVSDVLQQLNIQTERSNSAVSTALGLFPRGMCLPVAVLAAPDTPAAQYQVMPITSGTDIACGVGLPPQLVPVAGSSLPCAGSCWADNTHMAGNGLGFLARQDTNPFRPEALGWMFRC